jgi:SAM-dependent methyltransferase
LAAASRALEWLWQRLPEGSSPHLLDCGPVYQPTLDLFLRRGAKVYVADLITLALGADSPYWSRVGKTPVFLIEEFLAQLPPIPLESLSAVFCWHLLDLLPRDALAKVVERLFSYLKPGGVLFCLLREPYLAAGAETSWGLDGLTGLASGSQGSQPFAYPALTNREVERLVPGGNVKTFLTRTGRREVLCIK